jgi:hypothetical protein
MELPDDVLRHVSEFIVFTPSRSCVIVTRHLLAASGVSQRWHSVMLPHGMAILEAQLLPIAENLPHPRPPPNPISEQEWALHDVAAGLERCDDQDPVPIPGPPHFPSAVRAVLCDEIRQTREARARDLWSKQTSVTNVVRCPFAQARLFQRRRGKK